MGKKERQIIFMFGADNILCRLPLDAYEPGSITKKKEMLAKEMNCSPEEVTVKITGIQDGRATDKGPALNIQLIDRNTIKHFFE